MFAASRSTARVTEGLQYNFDAFGDLAMCTGGGSQLFDPYLHVSSLGDTMEKSVIDVERGRQHRFSSCLKFHALRFADVSRVPSRALGHRHKCASVERRIPRESDDPCLGCIRILQQTLDLIEGRLEPWSTPVVNLGLALLFRLLPQSASSQRALASSTIP